MFTTADGLPTSRVADLYLDRAGRLWIAMRRGLVRVDDPTAEHPNFVTYTTAQGLSSNYVTAITEDLVGRIYIGTGQGLDRLETPTGPIKHYTTADGLFLGEVVTAACDREGSIWIGGRDGLSRLQPEPTRSSEAPPILIKRLSIAGTSQHVSAIGETEVSLPDLSPSQNQLQIDFVGLSFAPGELLRYQYRLVGAAGDWTSPSAQRTVDFANLAPGRYRFLVRAVNSDGVTSPQPATITFIILRPIWQRWWFLTLVLLAAGAVGYAIYRYRVAQIVQMERVRTRIATDERGEATVLLPDYFMALNRDFRYQLTVIGQFAQAIVVDEIKDNRFTIKTDKPTVKVSWLVTGIRHDAYANANRIVVEENKTEKERGYYIHPQAFGQPEEKSVQWALYPEMMRQAKEQREKAQQNLQKKQE